METRKTPPPAEGGVIGLPGTSFPIAGGIPVSGRYPVGLRPWHKKPL